MRLLFRRRWQKKFNKRVGDSITFSESDASWRIAGLVPGAASFGNYYAWITYPAAQPFVTVPGSVSFAYIVLDHPADAEAVASSLQSRYPHLNIRSKADLVNEEKHSLGDSFLPILQAILVIAVLIGIAVVGLTIYTATVDKSREFGILKAIGLSNRQLYGTMLVQSLAVTALGLLIGATLSFGVGYLIMNWLDLGFELTAADIGLVAGLAVVMAFLASVVPVRRLITIDPAEVFKS
ncbi:FtsX-like permease family protein [Patescibacteria group bacterium]|nr:FtsX-like permease family protein [Patescibacteria group bacterium]